MDYLFCKPGVMVCATTPTGMFVKAESYILPDGESTKLFREELEPALALTLMEMWFDRILEILPEGCALHLIRMENLMQYKEAQRRIQQAEVVGEAQRILTEGETV